MAQMGCGNDAELELGAPRDEGGERGIMRDECITKVL
jgi:hypothetical protein